jgi:hypothetical protein
MSNNTASSKKATEYAPAERVKAFGAPTVWHVFTPLAAKHQAVNLGQGFPGWCPPPFVQKHGAAAVASTAPLANQYCRSAGEPTLAKKLAALYEKHLSRSIDWETEVMTANGATEVLFCAMNSLLDRGDEVVAFEPAFDIYAAQVGLCKQSHAHFFRSFFLFSCLPKNTHSLYNSFVALFLRSFVPLPYPGGDVRRRVQGVSAARAVLSITTCLSY